LGVIEASLRKWHRRLGIALGIFIVVQVITGLILNLDDFFEAPQWVSVLHRGLGDYGTAYRTLLSLGLLGLALTGGWIYLKIWQRRRKN
jgi:hypothetical protein